MIKAKRTKEIVINTVNEIGVLSEISSILAQKDIDVHALSCRVEGIKGIVHLVADNNALAFHALKEKKFEPFELDVVMVELSNEVGMLERFATELNRNKINLGYLYATALKEQGRFLLVASTSDIDRTIEVLEKLK